MTVRALRLTARRIQLLAVEAVGLRAELERLEAAVAPWLVELPGGGADQRRPGPATRLTASPIRRVGKERA